jgi:thiamine biosynthesis lipoprotein
MNPRWAMLAILALPRAASSAEPVLQRFTFEEPHMGTKFRIVLYAPDSATAQRASKSAFARVAELNAIMSDYDPKSELMQLCRRFATASGEPAPISADLFKVLAKAQEVARHSGGTFDVTIGPLVQLWRQSRRTQKLPASDEIEEAKRRVGYAKIELDAARRTVRLKTPGMQLDLGGIAKGFAADEMLAAVKKHGITRALAGAGGDVAVADPPPGEPGWKIDVAPLTKAKPEHSLRLVNAAVSTSGDAQQFVLIDGVRYSHVVDPRTGLGMTGRRSVSVIAPNGITADSMTKAVMLMEPARALELIEATPHAATLIITLDADGTESIRMSKRMHAVISK